MTIYQIQCLLSFLGLYRLTRKDGTVAIDGIPGPATTEAVKAFQRRYGIAVDGQCGPVTQKALRDVIANGWPTVDPSPSGYQWINPEDFRCRCGGKYCDGWPARPHKKTMDMLEQFGAHFGRKPVVHSGLRCDTWNRLQGGSPTSKHRLGMAVDFHIDGVSVEALAAYAEELMPGWGGIGKYSWGVHIDDRPVKGRWDNRGR